MKITKSRLLQIIREEVDLHEKKIESKSPENLEDASTEKEADRDGDGKLSKKEADKVLDDAIAGKMEEDTTSEDQIIKKNNGVIKPKPNKERLEIKIR